MWLRISVFWWALGLSLGCAAERAPTSRLVEPRTSTAPNEQREVAGLSHGRSSERFERETRALITKAHSGDFDGASTDFGPVMRAALPPSKLADTWRSIEEQVGPLVAIQKVTLAANGKVWASLATVRFKNEVLIVKVVYDERAQIVGLFFQPEEQTWAPPPYANQAGIVESDVQVGTNPALPGTLTHPRNGDATPAVVLVHGSGPADRDESVGGMKAFKDLALGLASRGIAVLRYEKRSRHAPAGIVTEKEEVLDAAHDAVTLLREHAGVDPARIFVLGHSQGGYLAPRIAKATPGIAGLIVLAGPTRSLQDLLIDQYTYFSTLHPDDRQLAQKIEQARAFKRRVEDPALRPQDDPRPPIGGGTSGAYYLFQRGYDPAATARALALPMLVLQGERDYQVTGKDLAGWKAGLRGTAKTTFKSYPSLNHFFVRSSGPAGPEEYQAAAHVDEEVIVDIATWITSVRAK